MTTSMPRDDDGAPLPVLRLPPGGSHSLAVSATGTRLGPFPPGTRVIGIYADQPMRVRTGDATVQASAADHFLPDGVYLDLGLGSAKTGYHTHLAAVAAAGAGTLHVSEKE